MSKLNINRDLIDSDFPGYKLSLDSLPLYDIEHELGNYVCIYNN